MTEDRTHQHNNGVEQNSESNHLQREFPFFVISTEKFAKTGRRKTERQFPVTRYSRPKLIWNGVSRY